MENTVKIKADSILVTQSADEEMIAEVTGVVLNPEEVCEMIKQCKNDGACLARLIEVIRPNGESRKYVPAGYTYGVPDIEEVMHKNSATIIRWADGTKTAVVCGKGETYDPYTGFMAAVMKKMFGSTGVAKGVHEKKNLEAQAAKIKAAEKKAEKIKAEREKENAARIAKRKAKAEARMIARMAEEIRIEMLAKEQAEAMINAEREKSA